MSDDKLNALAKSIADCQKILTLAMGQLKELRGSSAVKAEIPLPFNSPELDRVWADYQEWWFLNAGVPMNDIQKQYQLTDIARRGHSKSIADLRLTITKSTKPGTIWDSSREDGIEQESVGSRSMGEKL